MSKILISVGFVLLSSISSEAEAPVSPEWPARWEQIAAQQPATAPPKAIASILWAEMIQNAQNASLAVAQDDAELEQNRSGAPQHTR